MKCPRCKRPCNASTNKIYCSSCKRSFFQTKQLTKTKPRTSNSSYRFPQTKPTSLQSNTLKIARKEELNNLKTHVSNLQTQLTTLESLNDVDVTGPIDAIASILRTEKQKLRHLNSKFQTKYSKGQPIPPSHTTITRMGLPSNGFPEVHDHDIYALILNFLQQTSPCSSTAKMLSQEMNKHHLVRPSISLPWESNTTTKNNQTQPSLGQISSSIPAGHLRKLLSTSLTLLSCAESHSVDSSSLLDSNFPSSVQSMLIEAFMGGKEQMHEQTYAIQDALVNALIEQRQATLEYQSTQTAYEQWSNARDQNQSLSTTIQLHRKTSSNSYGIRINNPSKQNGGEICVRKVDRIDPTYEADETERHARQLMNGHVESGADGRCVIVRINGTRPTTVEQAIQLMSTPEDRVTSTLEIQHITESPEKQVRREAAGRYLSLQFEHAKKKLTTSTNDVKECRNALATAPKIKSSFDMTTTITDSNNHSFISSNSSNSNSNASSRYGFTSNKNVTRHLLRRSVLGHPVTSTSIHHSTASVATGLHLSRLHEIYQVDGHLSAPVYCVVFDRNGEYVITGADECLVKVWSVQTGRLMYTIRGHSNFITDIAVSIDNTTVASASSDMTLRISSLRNGETKNVLRGHTAQVNLIEYDPITGCLISISDDGTARVWSPTTTMFEEELEELEEYKNESNDFSIENARNEVAIVSHTSQRSNEDAAVDVLRIHPNGSCFMTCQSNIIRIFNIELLDGKQAESLMATNPVIPSEDRYHSAQEDGTVGTRWASGRHRVIVTLVGVIKDHQHITHGVFNHVGDRILSLAGKHQTVRVWSCRSVNNASGGSGSGSPLSSSSSSSSSSETSLLTFLVIKLSYSDISWG